MIVEPAPMRAPFPTVTGATSIVSLPTNTPSPSTVGCVMFLYGMPLLIGVTFGGYLADHLATRCPFR